MTTATFADLLGWIRLDGEDVAYFQEQGGQVRGFFAGTDLPIPTDRNIWFSLNPGTDGGKGRVTIDSVTRWAALSADLDVQSGTKSLPSLDAAKAVITDLSGMLGVEPMFVIFSGHGVQPVWPIDPEADQCSRETATLLLKRWGGLVKRVAQAHGGDADSVFELARLARVPGSVNLKDPARPVATGVISMGGHPIAPAEILETLNAYGAEAPVQLVAREVDAAGLPVYADLDQAEQARITRWTERAVQANVDDLRAGAALKTGETDSMGRGWDKLHADVAKKLAEIAVSPWSPLTQEQAHAIYTQHACRDAGWDKSGEKWAREMGKAVPRAFPAAPARVDDSDLFTRRDAGRPATMPSQDVASPRSRHLVSGDYLDVSNVSDTVDWLRDNLGAGRLSGVFYRKGEMVYTPQIGEEGYIEPKDTIADGAASISVVTHHHLRARIQNRYRVIRSSLDTAATKKAKEANPEAADIYKQSAEVFPLEAASIAVAAPDDMRQLRELKSVVHTPTFRADGTLVSTPGYDDASKMLFLPTGGQPGPVPEHPTQHDVDIARSWIDYMLGDFRFETASDRANYVGLMLTPLLRSITPSPYKLGVIEAHQPGSGKTFLARALMSIHGGLMHSEMPAEDEELRKVIATDLDSSTAPVLIFDNVTGLVRSSTLAGLLTSPTFQARRLGGNTLIEADNDRLWVITGNNAALGGDLQRRNVRVRIDPGVPDPEQRTDFAISDFEGWVRDHRGDLLWSLLTLVRAWISRGAPTPDDVRQDSYGAWGAAVAGILRVAGIPGVFDDPALQETTVDPETEEWSEFLQTVHQQFGDRPWTAKALLSLVSHPSALVEDPTKTIPFDKLPAGLLADRRTIEPAMLGKSLGRWIMNREGRWYGELTVRSAGKGAGGIRLWMIQSYKR